MKRNICPVLPGRPGNEAVRGAGDGAGAGLGNGAQRPDPRDVPAASGTMRRTSGLIASASPARTSNWREKGMSDIFVADHRRLVEEIAVHYTEGLGVNASGERTARRQ